MFFSRRLAEKISLYYVIIIDMSAIAYSIGDSLYLNITNRCTNECSFCIRNKARLFDGKHPLWLNQEPSAQDLIEEIGDPSQYKQIVFCGYGEPTIRLDVIKAVAAKLKSKSGIIIRLDTNGHGNLFWGRNIVPELKGLIDIVSVSLNAENAKLYNKICRSVYGEKAYQAVIEFIKECKKYIPQVEATVVDLPVINKEACKKIAEELGVLFRVRSFYDQTYVR
jgi:TatD DNase family protein